MWNVLRYPDMRDLDGRAQVRRSFASIEDAQEFILEQLAEGNGETWDYGIVKAALCDYCRKRPAVGHDGIAAYCKECKQ